MRLNGMEGSMQSDSVQLVSGDVNFAQNRFPDYGIGADDRIVDPEEVLDIPSMKEIVARETAQLLEQQKRLSVKELAKKFDKGLAAASKLSSEAKFRDAASLDRQVLLKKLRDILELLRGRVAGRNKDDVEEAVSMVEALAVQLTQREGELLQQKSEVKMLASFLKQASEDAKKMVVEAKTVAQAEIWSAREAICRVEKSFLEQERALKTSEKQDFEEFRNEVQEARRIKMSHRPSKVMDMRQEIQALRVQLVEKTVYALQLCKELAACRKLEQPTPHLYELDGSETLCSCLRIISCRNNVPDASEYTIQWYRVSSEDGKRDMISGATKSVYAPEPFDVGQQLQAEIILPEQNIIVTTIGSIDPAVGLQNYVEALVRKGGAEFNVDIIKMDGPEQSSHCIYGFHIGRTKIKLYKGRSVKAKETYSASMKMCGARCGGNAVAQTLFWEAKKGLSFALAFESARERNAAIMVARRFAADCNIMLSGPGDQARQRM